MTADSLSNFCRNLSGTRNGGPLAALLHSGG